MKTRISLAPGFTAALFAAWALSLSAQAQDGKTYRAATATQSAKEIEDIGEIDENKAGTKWRFNVSTRGQYTSNALLTGSHGSGDFLFLPTIEAGFHTPLGEHFSFDLSTKIESVIYSNHTDRGFIGYSALATLDYTFKPGLPRLYATVEPYRYDGFDSGELATQAVGFTGGFDWGRSFNGGRTVGFLGYSFSGYVADPSIDNRIAHRAVVGMAHQIRSNLTGQIYYVYQYSDYTDVSRDDSRHVVAGSLIYQFNDHLFGTFSSTFVENNSSQDHGSYESVGASIGLTLQY
jgi:hypothetical protein